MKENCKRNECRIENCIVFFYTTIYEVSEMAESHKFESGVFLHIIYQISANIYHYLLQVFYPKVRNNICWKFFVLPIFLSAIVK